MSAGTEQLVYADRVVALEKEPLVFLNSDNTIAGFFDPDIVEFWREQVDQNK